MTGPWITEPCGPLDMDDHEYHNDPVVGGSLSSSGARTLATTCPARYAYERQHRRPDTADFDFGHAAHMEVLGTGMPIVEIPYDEWRTKAAKDAVAAARAAGGVPLRPRDAQRVRDMAAALAAHPIAGPLFARPGAAEQTFVARDTDTNVMRRARVDWMPDVNGGRVLLVDYKSTPNADPAAFAKSMASYGYHQQGAFYSDVVAEVLGLDVPPRFVLIAQEKDPPHLVTIAEPDDEAIAWGRELNRHALRTYAACSAAGHWPGYEASLPADAGGIARLALPGWQVAAYERSTLNGATT